MVTRKTKAKKKDPGEEGLKAPAASKAYEQALKDFSAAIELLHAGSFAAAREVFEAIASSALEEPALVARARTFLTICDRRLSPPDEGSGTVDDLFYRAVIQSNDGNADEAIRLLDQALQQQPGSARLLYARASAWALKGNAEAAVGDLRQAIALEPTIRFQAVNDSDFSQIREEPAFIDIIEPTSTGV